MVGEPGTSLKHLPGHSQPFASCIHIPRLLRTCARKGSAQSSSLLEPEPRAHLTRPGSFKNSGVLTLTPNRRVGFSLQGHPEKGPQIYVATATCVQVPRCFGQEPPVPLWGFGVPPRLHSSNDQAGGLAGYPRAQSYMKPLHEPWSKLLV